MTEEETKKTKEFGLVEVPTQMGLAIRTPEGETLSSEELLVRMANDIDKIKKNLLG